MSDSRKLLPTDWLMLAGITVAVFLQRYSVLSSDPLLAWPITDSIAHPGRYSPDDLLVQAGVSGNFVLYKLLGHLPLLLNNFPLRDFLFYVPIYLFTLVAWWKLYKELGASRAIAAVSVLALAFSDDKLSLNWAHVVPAYFISATSVHFLQVFALLWFLRGMRNLALGVTAMTGYFHPASALSLGLVYCAMISYEAVAKRSWRNLTPVAVFAVLFAPAALMIALNNQGAIGAADEYFKFFERYQPQAYLGDHFRMGYAYTLVVIAFMYRYYSDADLLHKRDVFLFTGAALAWSVAWVANLYSIENLQFIHTFFPMRIFAVLHPLLVFLIVSTGVSLYRASVSIGGRVITVLAMLTPIYFSPPIAAAIVVAWAAYAMGRPFWPLLLCVSVGLYLGAAVVMHEIPLEQLLHYVNNTGPGRVGNEFNWIQIGILLSAIPVIFLPKRKAVTPPTPSRTSEYLPLLSLLCVVAILHGRPALGRMKHAGFTFSGLFNLSPSQYWGVRNSDPSYAELIDWVKQSPDRLFAIPPYDDRFLSFRYLSGRGAYVFHRDVAQLNYSPNYYVKAVKRLVEIAGADPRLPKAFMSGEVARANGDYETNCEMLMASPRFDAVIFEKRYLSSPACLAAVPAFENRAYVVFRTRDARSSRAD